MALDILIPPIYTYTPTTSTNVTLDQRAADNNTIGDLFHVFTDGSEITTTATSETIPIQYMTYQALRADRNVLNNQKYNNWNGLSDATNFHRFQINATNLAFTSHLIPIDASVTIATQLFDLPSAKSDNVLYADPWLVDFPDPLYGGALRNQGSGAPLKIRPAPFHPDLGTAYSGDVYYGVFLNAGYPNWSPPFYSIGAVTPTNIQGGDAYFMNWTTNATAIVQSSNSAVTGVVFTGVNASVTGIYKGHMRTGNPPLTDAQNQRRAISSSATGSGYWYTVYESMGDIWLALSTDNGTSWLPEERLNVIRGHGSNPTISNEFLLDYNISLVVVSWLEQNQSATEIHLQTMEITESMNHCYYGWKGVTGERSNANHRLLGDFIARFINPRTNARPTIQIDRIDNNLVMTYSYEGVSTGIITGTLVFPILGTNSISDLDGLPQNPLDNPPRRIISTNGSDTNPVIVSYPAAFGFQPRKAVYFIAGGYASGRRIAEYDYSTQAITVLATGSGDYTYTSLQGAPNPSSASFALAASGLNNSSQPFVNYYVKATYLGSSPASLSVAYPLMLQPTIMVQNSSVFGAPTSEVDMVSTSGTWSKGGSISLTTLGTSIAGVFAKGIVATGDRSSIVVRNNVTPARIDWYSGSGQLSKVGDIPVDIQAVRYWSQNGSPERPLILDFSGTDIALIDSLETGQTVCAVQILNPGTSGAIVRQVDSLALPLQVDLSRNGRTMTSFASSSWTNLTTGSIPQFSPGDILRFSLVAPARMTRGYLRISQRGVAVQKENSNDLVASGLQLLPNSVTAYPNPFNPSTTLAFQLAEPAMVKLIVYDVLGREVAQLVNGISEPGSHSVVWNASKVSSGVYYARFTATDGLGNSKANQVTRLLLTK